MPKNSKKHAFRQILTTTPFLAHSTAVLSMPLPLTDDLLADARPQGSAQGGAQASPRPRARARGHQGPQAEPQGDAQLPQGGVRGPHQVQLLNMLHLPA